MFDFDLTLLDIIFCIVMFFTAGLIDSIAGGGGLISLPTLLLTGLPPHVALGTNKLALCIGTVSAFITYLKKGQIVIRLIAVGFISSALGASIGSWIALKIDPLILGRIVVFLLPIGLAIMLFCGTLTDISERTTHPALLARGLAIGLGIGFYDGFFGPGAGSFYIIALFVFGKLNLVKASGTAKMFNLGSNAGAVATFATGGTIYYLLVLPLALACVAGNCIGAQLAVKLGARLVHMALYCMLAVLSLSLIYRFFIA